MRAKVSRISRLTVRAFRVHVYQPHLHGRERALEFTVAAVAFVAEPLGLGAPVDVFFGLPYVFAPTGEAECFQAHIFQCAVAGEDEQVGPR